LQCAGTFDQRWIGERAPFWSTDLDSRFFEVAFDGLRTVEPLQGGEPVRLEGFSPDGDLQFELPRHRLLAKAVYGDRELRCALQLQGVQLEPDEASATLFWRCAVPLGRGPTELLTTFIRLLEPWESAPC
jgi:hypothetical protein